MNDGPALPVDADVDCGSLIPDLNEVPIEVLLDDGDSVLNDALRRLVCDMGRPAENYAAHSNSI